MGIFIIIVSLSRCKGSTFLGNMYQRDKIFWLGEIIYPRTISPKPLFQINLFSMNDVDAFLEL